MKVRIINPFPKCDLLKKKRVAAYCRVSTLQEIQHHSLEAQTQYYERKIRSVPGWEFAGVFADQASGRCNLKMRQFQEMLKLCLAGDVDLILIKSISRLGRNTVELLQVCNRLNQIGVDVYFEIENLHISDPEAVRMLTIFAGLYQHESESKSAAIKWGITVGCQSGTSKLYNRPCYGYRQNEKGELVVCPEEAENVQMIFHWHKLGLSLREISAGLAMAGIKAPSGGSKWCVESIRRILNNEKYRGDVLLQKTYVANFFTGERKVNKGECKQYLMKEHHMAIDSK